MIVLGGLLQYEGTKGALLLCGSQMGALLMCGEFLRGQNNSVKHKGMHDDCIGH